MAGPVLLASVQNSYVAYSDSVVSEWNMQNVVSFHAGGSIGTESARLFDQNSILLRANEAPVTVNDSVNSSNAGFPVFARGLTDGLSSGPGYFEDLAILGQVGGENLLDVHVPRISQFDLFGYAIDRIDRHITYQLISPGRDLNGNGQWTDFYVGGVYEFWGHPVPEPGSCALLACAAFIIASHKRFRTKHLEIKK